jgi:hypothetical protein
MSHVPARVAFFFGHRRGRVPTEYSYSFPSNPTCEYSTDNLKILSEYVSSVISRKPSVAEGQRSIEIPHWSHPSRISHITINLDSIPLRQNDHLSI